MDIRSAYRVGSPALISHPFNTIRLQSVPQWQCEEFHKHIDSTLEDAGVRVVWTELVKRHRAGTDVENIPLTLLITSDLSVDGQYTCWITAAARLRRLLDASGLENILVEITDQRAALAFSTRPILRCKPDLISNWESFIPTLLAEIENRDWLAIDVVEREFGIRAPFKVPTILVTTKDADNELWRQKIIPRLRTRLPVPFDIDILYASTLSYVASGEETDSEETVQEPIIGLYSTMADYSATVRMGASIGLDDPRNSATVGAVIRLRDSNGNETTCGLTNHHVVAREGSLTKKCCPIGQFLGPDHPVCKDGLVKIVAPSHSDHERFVKYTRNHIRSLSRLLTQLAKQHRHESHQYKDRTKQLDGATADLKVLLDNPDRSLGTVWATSGYRVCNNSSFSWTERRDISTVKKEEMTGQKDAQSPCLQTLINDRCLSFGLNWALVKLAKDRELSDAADFPMPAGLQANQFTRIEKDKSYKVVKKGRTTGLTCGTISRIRSLLNLKKDDEDNANIVPVDLRTRFGNTDGIVLTYGVFHEKADRDFMKDGDSGSCVLLRERDDDNENATLIGLLFASNELTRVSYMMPMDMVINDIEHVTGHTVIQPMFVEYADRLG